MSLRKKMKTSEVAARFPRRHLHRQIGFRSDDATAPVKSTRDPRSRRCSEITDLCVLWLADALRLVKSPFHFSGRQNWRLLQSSHRL